MSERQDERKLNKYNLPIILAGVLFTLVLVTTHLTSGLYAKYTVTATHLDGARVASFGSLTLNEKVDGVVVVDQADPLKIVPGVDISKKVYVDFSGSEMDTYIFVAINPTNWTVSGENSNENRLYTFGSAIDNSDAENPEKVPILSWTVDDAWTFLRKNEDTGEYVYYYDDNPEDNSKHLESNKTLTEQDIIKEISEDGGKYISVSEWATEKDLSEIEASDLVLSFRALVVQASGFDDAEKAWEAVK